VLPVFLKLADPSPCLTYFSGSGKKGILPDPIFFSRKREVTIPMADYTHLLAVVKCFYVLLDVYYSTMIFFSCFLLQFRSLENNENTQLPPKNA
jgi:hypothetical protein